MVVTLEPDLLGRYRRFTLHNSPYVAHDAGCAVDLYPAAGAPSPVAGDVVDVRTVAAPPKPYAADDDHLLLIAVDRAASPVSWDDDAAGRTAGAAARDGPGSVADAVDRDAPADRRGGADDPDGGADDPDGGVDDPDGPLLARVLHVDPAVAPGDAVAVGDPLGRPIRAGFFAPWVAPHLHVGFRAPGADPYRASGSLPLAAGVAVEPQPWDGTGTVVERGDTYAVLDAPEHPAPGERFVGLAARVGHGEGRDATGAAGTTVALDGGLPHYDGGGLLGARAGGTGDGGSGVREGAATPPGDAGERGGDGPVAVPVTLLGERVGVVADGRVAWDDVTVSVDGEPATGLSLFAARDGRFGAKVVCPDGPPALGETVTVSLRNRSPTPGRR